MDSKKIEEKILKEITKKFEGMPGIKVVSVLPELTKNIYANLVKDVQYLKHFSESELKEEIGVFVSSLFREVQLTEEEYQEKIENFTKNLGTEKEYTAIFVLPGTFGVPIGTRIGEFEIIEVDLSDNKLKELIEGHFSKLTRFDLKKCVWVRTKFKSYRNLRIHELLYKKAESLLPVLSFALHSRIPLNNLMGYVISDNGDRTIVEPSESLSAAHYIEEAEKSLLTQLSEISSKKKNTPVESKILHSLDIYWLSQLSQKPEIELLLLISTLESLLLSNNDRDFFGSRLAEKSAFLLSDNRQKRIEISKFVMKMYDRRSRLVHQGVKNINDPELDHLKLIVLVALFKMLELSSKYEKINRRNKQTEQEGIEDLLLNLKFD
jgi:hypothetical protein